MARADGISVEMVIVDDDVALKGTGQATDSSHGDLVTVDHSEQRRSSRSRRVYTRTSAMKMPD